MTVEELRRVCHVVRDTTELGEEALAERVIAVQMGRDTISATIDSGRVWRIVVENPALMTRDSLHVGMTLARLIEQGEAVGLEGEDALYVQVKRHCGLSFRIVHELRTEEHRQEWSERDLRRLPPASPVDRILVTGCNA